MPDTTTKPKKYFIPNVSDHTLALAGVIRGMGIDCQVLPKFTIRLQKTGAIVLFGKLGRITPG